MDSGCTLHLFSDKSLFKKWDTSFNPGDVQVILADGKKLDNAIQGKGLVQFTTTDCQGVPVEINIPGALYMPSCEYTGIYSVKKGVERGVEVHFTREGSYIKTTEGQQIPLKKRGNLLFVNACKASVKNRTALQWHYILAHLNFPSLYKMQHMVQGMQITHANKRACKPCIRAKAKQHYSKTPDIRANSPFEFIHSDISGPYNVPDTPGGHKYVITFVDDYSNFMVVYSMKNKSDCSEAFRRFLAFVRRFGPKNSKYGPVKKIRTDNAKEYSSGMFEEICVSNQIHHEYSPPHCPWCNGTAERSFGTLGVRVRSILEASQVPLKLWPQAFKYAAYLYNRSPVERIKKTPYEAVMNKKPNVSTLEAFGSPCEALDPHPVSKLSSRTKSGTFVGFDPKSDAYLVYSEDDDSCKAVNRVFFHDDPLLVDNSPKRNISHIVQDELKRCKCTQHGFTDLPEAPDTGTSVGQSATNTRRGQLPSGDMRSQASVQDITSNDVYRFNDNMLNDNDMLNNDDMLNDNNMVNDNNGSTVSGARPKRKTSAPVRYGNPIPHEKLGLDYCLNMSISEYCYGISSVPKNFNEAINHENSNLWWEAMEAEYDSLVEHNTFSYVKRPNNTRIIPGMWVFNIKREVDGSTRYKARWVAKGYAQTYGVNYTDTYAPMSRMTTIRIVMFLCVQFGLIAHQLDVCTAYLNSDLDHIVLMEPPKGFCNDKTLVCRLNKSLYGLKQSAKLWNDTLNEFLVNLGFRRSQVDMCLYIKTEPKGLTIIIIWVDDIILLGSNQDLIDTFKAQIKLKFKVKDHGKLRYFLGIEFEFNETGVKISQSGYCKTVIDRFGMSASNPQKIPTFKNVFDELRSHQYDEPFDDPTKFRELVGSLLYLQQVTRPDISFVTNVLGQQMAKPTQFHWQLGLKVIRYLKGTINYSLNYKKVPQMELIGMVDSDFANGLDRKSMTGYVFTLASQSSPISWGSKKQNLVATSVCNAEYVALSAAVCEGIYLQSLLKDIDMEGLYFMPAKMYCDNTGACSLALNPCHHPRTKHIDVKHHHVRDHIARKTIILNHLPGSENLADGFTKALPIQPFNQFSQKLQNV